MIFFIKKFSPQISIIFLTVFILSVIFYPTILGFVGVTFILFSLFTVVSSIIEKHKGTENSRPKIIKGISVLIATILLITFLGGLAGMFANYYASLHFGVVWGIISALAASFVVGYLVRWGVGKFSKQ